MRVPRTTRRRIAAYAHTSTAAMANPALTVVNTTKNRIAGTRVDSARFGRPRRTTARSKGTRGWRGRSSGASASCAAATSIQDDGFVATASPITDNRSELLIGGPVVRREGPHRRVDAGGPASNRGRPSSPGAARSTFTPLPTVGTPSRETGHGNELIPRDRGDRARFRRADRGAGLRRDRRLPRRRRGLAARRSGGAGVVRASRRRVGRGALTAVPSPRPRDLGARGRSCSAV